MPSSLDSFGLSCAGGVAGSAYSVLKFSDDVIIALESGLPVVALESTLIAHGLPWPDNLETARAAAKAVRDAGGLPATIAVLGGRPTVGMAQTPTGCSSTISSRSS